MTRKTNYRNRMLEGGEGYNPFEDDGMSNLIKMDAARVAKYGASSCPKCGQVYRCNVTTHIVEDHVCEPSKGWI